MIQNKFKAWDKKTKSMKDVLVIDYILQKTWIGTRSVMEERDFKDVEFMQSTGFTDRKNQDLYENDIVELDYPYDKRHVIIGVIMYSPYKASFGIYMEQTAEVYDLNKVTADNFLRVVGNIYEDKEMLTKWLAKKILKDS